MININQLANIICPQDITHNIYYRKTNQLKKHLKNNGFLVDEVSRSNIGDTNYYNVELNVPDDTPHERISFSLMERLLGIKNMGLVDFYKYDGMIHVVVLIDEGELDAKYLNDDGNLVFDNEVKEIILKHLKNPTELSCSSDEPFSRIIFNFDEIADDIISELKEKEYLK